MSMSDKEVRVVRKHTKGLPRRLYELVLERLEKALKDRPFWLKLVHFLKGNAKWIEETVREIVDKVRSEFGDEEGSEEEGGQ